MFLLKTAANTLFVATLRFAKTLRASQTAGTLGEMGHKKQILKEGIENEGI
jgi:hypothetical protein